MGLFLFLKPMSFEPLAGATRSNFWREQSIPGFLVLRLQSGSFICVTRCKSNIYLDLIRALEFTSHRLSHSKPINTLARRRKISVKIERYRNMLTNHLQRFVLGDW